MAKVTGGTIVVELSTRELALIRLGLAQYADDWPGEVEAEEIRRLLLDLENVNG